jgi:hypothetical protein
MNSYFRKPLVWFSETILIKIYLEIYSERMSLLSALFLLKIILSEVFEPSSDPNIFGEKYSI